MNQKLDKLQNRIAAVEKKENLKSALNGLYLTVLILFSIFIFFSLLEALFNFNSHIRSLFFFITIALPASSFSYFVLLPLIKNYLFPFKINYELAAQKIGDHFPEIKDELKNALQLVNDKSENYSPLLIDAAFERVYKKTEKYNFDEIIDFNSTNKTLKILVAAILLSIALFASLTEIRTAAYRLINFNKEFTTPPKFVFEIQPGNAEVTKGDDIIIKIKTSGSRIKNVNLFTKFAEQSEFSDNKLLSDSFGYFTYSIRNIKSSLNYFASADGITSQKYKITVINRPFINSLEVKITPPSYSQLPTQYQKDNGNIIALPGSKILISLLSSRELNSAAIYFSDSSKQVMHCNDIAASTSFIIKKSIDYKIIIQDKNRNTNANPITYSIKTLTDLYPDIQVLSPNKDLQLDNNHAIPFTLKIKDDYGFTKLLLHYRIYESKYRQLTDEFSQISIPITLSSKEEDVYYVWDLSPLVLAEGEALTYYFEIFDNDNINGPKQTKSPSFTVQVPSLNDIFKTVDNTQSKTTEDLKQVLQEANELHQELRRISEELKQDKPQINWDEKERIEKATTKFNDINQKIKDISQKLSETQNELMKRNLLSEETLKKYMELQNLLEQLSSDEFKEAMKKLQEALQNLMRDQVQQSLENFKIDEEYFRKSIERTVNLLKRIQIEQKIDELIKRTDELQKKIQDLESKTKQGNLNDKALRDELSKRQNDITKEFKDLEDTMESLNKKMNEIDEVPKEEMNKILQNFEQQNNNSLSQQASEQITQQKKNEALQNQQQMQSNLQSLSNQIKNMQTAMQQQYQAQMFKDMVKIIDNLLTLSKEQEELKNNTEQVSTFSQQMDKYARKQNELQNSLEKIMQQMADLSQKTFAITPEMGKALGDAISQMNRSTNSLQNKNNSAASSSQQNAISSLNEAALLMKSSLEQMMNGSGSGGMMSLFQQLQKMAQQQMGLNQITQMLQQGKYTQQQLAEMQRLAQQQELIRKSLEQLNQEAKESGQSKRLAANLDKILQDMQEVVTNLQTQKLDDNLIKQQERILSKLLDAQKSINERDYEETRQSNTGKDIQRQSPPELELAKEKSKNKLKDELIRAINEGYKKDYEELIRKYFEALQNEKEK
ncbi:DUF4175 family protein [Melioribacteraceae bacterium 4301-Me]|uniref:DUF4175 family protein n=1 Tax=Pyranulibacter aquaticus TaxID=3163344 RepID=UPI003599FCD3